MTHQNPVFRGPQVKAMMETVPNTFPDTQLLMQFYGTLFRMLVMIYGGALVVALACILWLLWFDGMHSAWFMPCNLPRTSGGPRVSEKIDPGHQDVKT